MNANLVLIHGYAQAGKTTLENQLTELGYRVLSTSRGLDHMVCDYMQITDKLKRLTFCNALQKKKDAYVRLVLEEFVFNTHHYNLEFLIDIPDVCRQLKIHLAENVFRVDEPGRIVRYIMEDADFRPNELVFATSVGGAEGVVYYDYWNHGGVYPVNIRREGELAGVDIRKLAPGHGIDFWNNGNEETLAEDFLTFLHGIYKLD